MVSTLVGSILVCKYLTRVEVNLVGKHSSLLQYGNIGFVVQVSGEATFGIL